MPPSLRRHRCSATETKAFNQSALTGLCKTSDFSPSIASFSVHENHQRRADSLFTSFDATGELDQCLMRKSAVQCSRKGMRLPKRVEQRSERRPKKTALFYPKLRSTGCTTRNTAVNAASTTLSSLCMRRGMQGYILTLSVCANLDPVYGLCHPLVSEASCRAPPMTHEGAPSSPRINCEKIIAELLYGCMGGTCRKRRKHFPSVWRFLCG